MALAAVLAVAQPMLVEAQINPIEPTHEALPQDKEDPVDNPVPLALKDAQMAAFSFYPNPARDVLNLNFGRDGSTKLVEVYDLIGNLALRKSLSGVETRLAVGQLKSGVYLLRVGNETYRFEKI